MGGGGDGVGDGGNRLEAADGRYVSLVCRWRSSMLKQRDSLGIELFVAPEGALCSLQPTAPDGG